MKTTLSRIFVLVVLFGAIGQSDSVQRPSYAASQTNVTVEGNTLKLNGQPVRLLAYGDFGMLAESNFDYAAHFRTLRSYNLNAVRVWANYHWADSLTPYQGSRGSKYDTGRASDAFYTRLGNFVREADRNGVVVILGLFDANALETGSSRDKHNNRWANSPLNKANNRNGYLTTRSKYFTTDATCNSSVDRDRCIWSHINTVIIDKVTEQTGNLGNVIYEVATGSNSSTGASSSSVLAFNREVVERLSQRLQSFSGSKVIAINADSSRLKRWALDEPAVSMYTINLKGGSGPSSSDLRAAKPVLISNDGSCTQTTNNYTKGHPDRTNTCSGAVSSGAAQVRANKTQDLLRRVFPSTSATGRVGFDFVDKDLNGSSWPRSGDYNPRAGNLDRRVLEKLRSFAR